MEKQINKIWVSFLVLTSILLLTSVVAATSEVAEINSVRVKGIEVFPADNVASVIGDETISVIVIFEALESTSHLRMKAEIEGTRIDSEETVFVGDVEEGKTYIKSLTLKVPYELRDQASDDLILRIRLWNREFRTEVENIPLRVQRDSYDLKVMSIETDDTVYAGDVLPVNAVLRNTGYNDLRDLYVTARIPSLNVEEKVYFGDLAALKDDTESKRLFLNIPYDIKPGEYTLELKLEGRDIVETDTRKILVRNEFVSNLVPVETRKTANVGEEAIYEFIVVNPTDRIKVYNVLIDSPESLSVTSIYPVVSVSADSSRIVRVSAKADTADTYNFDVHVFSDDKLTGKTSLTLKVEDDVAPSPMAVLTIILAIVFVVLLVVLIVLLTKKPKKQEEFEESYY